MATFTVTTNRDVVNAGDGVLSLREALNAANATRAADTIVFDLAADQRTITLAGSQLTASADVTIDGGSGVTIDANELSRVLLVQSGTDIDATDVTFAHLKITGGRTFTDNEAGGGILADRYTALLLDHTTVIGNSTAGYNSRGGGVSGFDVNLTSSAVSGNNTTGDRAFGGGIDAYSSVTLTNSVISGNSTGGFAAIGGGIFGLNVTLTDSTVNGNRTTGYGSGGGGIDGGIVALTNSTVSGNSTEASGNGGGIFSFGSLMIIDSTVSGNSTNGDRAGGGGIFGDTTFGGYVTLANSIVAGNTTVTCTNPDLVGDLVSNGHNIFGSTVEGAATGDLQNVPTSLLFAGGLTDNGGPTLTIALLDSPLNPALAGADPADSPATDQRGEARPQPAGTAPDIGAFELNQTGGPLNEIVGTSRGEFLSGTTGNDLIRGLGGDDRLWGRPGDDVLFGGTGRDVLAGKGGVDDMTGGNGADRFLFRHVADAPMGFPNYDEILDFRRAQHDKIDLRPIDSNRAIDGNQRFTFIGEHDFTQDGQLRYQTTADGDILVSGNTDRDLAAEFAFVVHTGAEQLNAADFLL